MNIIDKNFNNLVKEIKNQSLEEVYQSIRSYFANIPENIQFALEDYFIKFPYWGKLNKKENNYEELFNRAESLKKHIEDYVWLYNHLQDYRSKKLLFAILNNWYQFDFDTLNTSIEKNYPHYFDLDIIKSNKDEVIVDLGAYTGDTILDYINYYGTENYKKIYCYEITDEIFKILQNNLYHYPNINYQNSVDHSANMIDKTGEIEIDTTTIDEDIKEVITLIKMDIEGSEQKALIGCEKHIKNDHPKLLISVYHNHEDLWKIPKMIENMCPGYKFYLRYYGNNIFPTEIVLLGIYE